MSIAEVIWWQLMEQRTMNGKHPIYWSIHLKGLSFWVLLGTLVMQGCAHDAQPSPPPSLPTPTQMSSTLALEAQAEAESLRTSLAAERIKSAKQAADVRTAKEEATSLKARELEHTETISTLKTEVATLKAERDKLRTEVAQLRAKTAAAPKVLQLVTQMRTMETSLNGLSSSLETLSEDILALRDEVEQQKVAAKPTPTPKGNPLAQNRMGGTDLIVVKRGDSLWRLSQTYGTTVNELKHMNGLTHDTIVIGQFLKIPSEDELDPEELVELPNPKGKPAP